MLPLAEGLVDRGHEVRFYTGSAFRTKVESSGAIFEPMVTPLDPGERPLAECLPALRGVTGLSEVKAGLKYFFIHSSVGQVADLRRIQREWKADAIITDTAFAGAAYLHELGEGPVWVAVNTLPMILSSRDTAPFGPGIPPLGGPLGRARNAALRMLTKKVIFSDVIRHNNAVRAGIGLPRKEGLIFDNALSPYLFLQASVEALEYPRRDLPPQVHFVGPMTGRPPSLSELPPWWDELTSTSRPVVHVTQGTVNTAADRLLKPAISALAGEDVLVVVTTGGADVATLGPLPANVRAAEFVPHAILLPRVSAMVTNGGFGGVQTALSYGVPLVVAGDTEDKPEVANRVAFAGAGINLRTGAPSEGKLLSAVRRVLAEKRFRERASEIALEIRRHDGVATASRLIEQLVDTGVPVVRPAGEGTRDRQA
ncbi:nucleotide disphospho-sugar-binding domain-containing protein [Plantactinospora sp. KBS50]|uniref:nucleotide disphospho-sugar-binding domain-containing protein n=1 Tax=Plantactinospora sp. KBS50 TaxID=2024580 RepID=UPI001E433006|nr:nucleotide disphospho-sugar-binding domain-containing protein [Plantactinospora sp. KBS50]